MLGVVDAETEARAVSAGCAMSNLKSRVGILEFLRVLRLAHRTLREQIARHQHVNEHVI